MRDDVATEAGDGGERSDHNIDPEERSRSIRELEYELTITRQALQRAVDEAELAKNLRSGDAIDVDSVTADLKRLLEQTQRQLAQTERQLRAITDATPARIAYVDGDRRYRFVNQAYAHQFGREPSEVLGKTVPEIMGPENFADVEPHLEKALAGERQVFELTLHPVTTADTVIKEVTYVPDIDDNGGVSGFYVMAIDITDRKLAIMELARMTERISLAMESAEMGSFEWDPETDEMYWDDQHRAITGLTDEHPMVGKTFLSLIHPDDVAENRRQIERAIETDGDFKGEFRIIRPDGTIRWLAGRAKIVPSADGQGRRLIGLNWDITEQKKTLARVRLGEDRLRLAAEAAGFGTYQIDLISGKTYWSPELKKLVGASEDADQNIRPGHVPSFVHPDDREAVAQEYQHALRSDGGGTHSFTHRIRLPDGRQRWVRQQGKTVFSELSGRPLQVIGTLLDITQQKLTEQSLEEARRVAEAANQSKSEFLANMSHEIRTPMSAIMGFTDILSRQLTDPDNLKCASIIRHNGQFLLEIINDILDISKIEAGKLALTKKRFRPDQLVADVRSLMEVRAAEKGIPLEVNFDGRLPKTICSDNKRLKQILVNLIGNAIKFTDSGKVELVIRLLPDESNPMLQFDVIDTGIGMTPSQQKKLFQPFTQADSSAVREYGGTGLGLTISQRLAEMLGGAIAVQSVSKIGSRFSLTIQTGSLNNVPLVEPHLSVSRAILPPPPKNRPALSGHVLVVDDRRDMRFIAQQLIEEAGGTVESAENGLQAIQRVKEANESGAPFDLITMDMQMPVLDGYQATRKLRQLGFAEPIIAVTAHAMEGDRQTCLDIGCTDYVPKPINGPKFVSLLADYLVDRPADTAVETDATGRVLVIDDSQDACESIKTLLEFDGYRVDAAHDAASGLAAACRTRPDVILLDLGLPDFSGMEVLRQLRGVRELDRTMLIAATGQDITPEIESAGFDHCLVKPLNIDQLEGLIQRHFQRDS